MRPTWRAPPKKRRYPRGRPKPRPATSSSWNVYLAWYSPAKWVGTVEAIDADAAIAEATKLFKVDDPRKLIAVRRQ
jgi:hypothetical protein